MLLTSTSREGIEAKTRTAENIKFSQRVNPLCLLFCVYGLGAGFLTIGIITCCFWKHYYNLQLISELTLSNSSNSRTTGLWLSNNVPRYLKVHMFNWTNSEKSLTGEEVPQFEECGPYTFSTQVFKEGVVWNDNDTVSYRQRRSWIFVPELSNGSLSDEIVTINVVAVALTYHLKYVSRFLLQLVNEMIKYRKIPLVIRETVSNQLFNGYDDGILSTLEKIRNTLNSFNVYDSGIQKLKNLMFLNKKNSTEEDGSSISFLINRLKQVDNIKSKFAWWYQQNMTEVHDYNIHTGHNDINKFGNIHSWDYKIFCPGNKKISGSLGEMWPMNTPNKVKASAFVPEMCSFIDLMNVGPKKVYGIDGIEFIGNQKTFGPARNSAEEFLGVQNITDMVKAPIFISFPHFYEANETFRKAIKGMQPNREKHEFYMVLQKDSGVVLSGKGRIQLNILLEPVNEIELVRELPRLLFPTIWFELSGVIPPYLVDQMKFGFVVIPVVLTNFGMIAIIVGILFLVSGFIFVHVL